MKGNRLLYGVVGLAAVALLAAAWFVFYGGNSATTAGAMADQAKVTLVSTDRTLGKKGAPIVMVEYAAPTCPICARFNNELFSQLKANYIDTGKVYYVFRVFPLQSVDVAAETMARCLPEKSYFQFIDLLYRNQPMWDPDGYQIPDVHAALVNMGRMAGMSSAQVDQCIGNQQEQQRIAAVGQDATARYEINGTPTFIVNGQIHSTFANWQELKDYLDSRLGSGA